MARISLTSAIDTNLVERFSRIAQGSTTSGANILSGNSSEVSIRDTLRLGARTYGTVVQGLNSLVSFGNLGRSNLEELSTITEKLITITKRASEGSIGSDARNNLDREFKALGKEFQKIVENSKVGEHNYLDREGLSELFAVMGLDSKTSQSISDLFARFEVTDEDTSLASEHEKGARPVPIPPNVPGAGSVSSLEADTIFESGRNIRTRPAAYVMLSDLKALDDQIETNIKAIDNAVSVVKENISLVRAVGFAFLNLSDQVSGSEDASSIAQSLRSAISQRAGASLRQVENLDAVTVAALTLSSSSL